MLFVKKPSEGFNSPYQALVTSLSEYMIKTVYPKSKNGDVFLKRWSDLKETECEIAVPTWDDKKQQWNILIQSTIRGIKVDVPLIFKTITVEHFLDNALQNVKRQNSLGKAVKDLGFYFTKDTKQIVLVLYSDFDFKTPIQVQGWEFLPEMYTVSKDKQTLIIDCPVVKGTVNLLLIDNPNSLVETKEEVTE